MNTAVLSQSFMLVHDDIKDIGSTQYLIKYLVGGVHFQCYSK